MVIKSTSYSNSELIKSILKLHVPNNQIDCDPTCSKGIFYKDTNIEPPRLRFDLIPQTEGCLQADCRHLPIEDDSLNCIMFDPPFVICSGPSLKTNKQGQNIISKRFSSFSIPLSLYNFYSDSLREFYRILKNGGVLIVKCQDTVSSSVQYMSHVYIHNMAVKCGFYPKDLFILNAKGRLISSKHKNQKHARKYHSYFWVFEKGNKKLEKAKKFNYLP